LSARRRRDEDKTFAGAMDDVVPLKDRGKIRTPPAAGAAARRVPTAEAPHFVVETRADRVEGRVDGVNRKTLARLRRGEIPADEKIDLHGFTARAARRALVEQLEAGRARGARCVLVIHGLGRHSETGPVLKDALPDWLQRSPLAEIVTAFCTAPAKQGGSGALLVLMRRAR